VGALAALHVAVFAWVAWARVTYPFDLEWMEGGDLLHAQAILDRRPLYAPPTTSFAAFLYTPLYPLAVAAVARVAGGVSWAVGRGVSIAASAGLFVLVWATVRRHAAARHAVLAVGLLAALHRFGGTFLDLARADALALFFALAGACVADRGRRWGSAALAALLLVLAVLAKQSVAPVAVAVTLAVALRRDGRGAVMLACGAALGLAAGAFLEATTSGWFSFYVVRGHASHPLYLQNLSVYMWRDVLLLAPLLLVLPVAWCWARQGASLLARVLAMHLGFVWLVAVATVGPPHMYLRDVAWATRPFLLWVPATLLAIASLALVRGRELQPPSQPPRVGAADGDAGRFWAIVYGGALAASALGHATAWAYKNALLPAAVFGSVVVALAAAALETRAPRRSTLVPAMLAFQLALLLEAPWRLAPDGRDRAKLDELTRALGRLEGRVLVVAHPLLALRRDGTRHLHQMSIVDVEALGGVRGLADDLAAGRFRYAVTDEGDGLWTPPLIAASFEPIGELDGPAMRTGVLSHPARLWRWRPR